jgi:hypothetical protein
MSPSLLLLVPAVASAMGLPVLDSPSPTDLGTAVQQFASETAAVLSSVDYAIVDIVRVAYVTCLLIGVLLYYTHLGRRLGRTSS